jgi:hypothetical protein
MKKGIYAFLAALIVSALAMTGCPTDVDGTTYTVTFDKNGGTSEASPQTASTDTSGGQGQRTMISNSLWYKELAYSHFSGLKS